MLGVTPVVTQPVTMLQYVTCGCYKEKRMKNTHFAAENPAIPTI